MDSLCLQLEPDQFEIAHQVLQMRGQHFAADTAGQLGKHLN